MSILEPSAKIGISLLVTYFGKMDFEVEVKVHFLGLIITFNPLQFCPDGQQSTYQFFAALSLRQFPAVALFTKSIISRARIDIEINVTVFYGFIDEKSVKIEVWSF